MFSDSKGLTIYRMNPEEVEKFLSEKYGDKLIAVNFARLAKQKQKRSSFSNLYRNSGAT